MSPQSYIFKPFSFEHWVTVLITVVVMIAFPLVIKKRESGQTAKEIAVIFAFILLVLKIGEPLFRIYNGEEWTTQLPLQMCDIGALMVCFFLLKPNMFLFEIAYFWGLGGGIQALLTPDVKTGFPTSDFWFFFITHGLCMIGVIYAIVVFNYRPVIKSIWRAFIVLLGYAAIIFPLNLLLDTNYLFLLQKPLKASLMDYLGEWPWYILSLVVVSLVVFSIYYSPFFFKDLFKER